MTPKTYIAQAQQAERLARALSAPDQTALLGYAERLRAEAAKTTSSVEPQEVDDLGLPKTTGQL